MHILVAHLVAKGEMFTTRAKVLDGNAIGVTLLLISEIVLALASWANLFFSFQTLNLSLIKYLKYNHFDRIILLYKLSMLQMNM